MPSLGGEQSQAAGGKHHGFRHRRSRISNRPWIQQEQPQGKGRDRPIPQAIENSKIQEYASERQGGAIDNSDSKLRLSEYRNRGRDRQRIKVRHRAWRPQRVLREYG